MPSEPLPPEVAPTDIVLTRRRWGWYFVPGLVAATALAVWAILAAGVFQPLAGPVVIGLLWWLIRRSTPSHGTRHRRMSADPEFFWLMAWGVLICTGAVLAHRYAGPLEGTVLVVLMCVFLVGVFVLIRPVDRRLKEMRKRAADTAWQRDTQPTE
jgi:hypothetical protein